MNTILTTLCLKKKFLYLTVATFFILQYSPMAFGMDIDETKRAISTNIRPTTPQLVKHIIETSEEHRSNFNIPLAEMAEGTLDKILTREEDIQIATKLQNAELISIENKEPVPNSATSCQTFHAVDDLTNHFGNMALTNQTRRERWTHFPENGDTLYITNNTHITSSSKHHALRRFEIVDVNLMSFFSNLNHQLYFFKGYGKSSNHLFVSFKICMSLPDQENLFWKRFVLCWDDSNKQFLYHDFEILLPHNVCFANFYNHTHDKWEEDAPKDVNGHKVKFVNFHARGIQGVVNGNSGHSEPGALGLLEARKDLMLGVIRSLNPIAKIKMFQLGLHSFLDFCEDCNPMVSTFQNNYCNSLLNYLQTNLPVNFSLKHRIIDKPSHILFFMNGINNRFYLKKSYFYYEKEQEHKHNFTNYFLQQYRPFTGDLPWNKKGKFQARLLTFINEPVAQPDSIESLPNNLRVMIPLNKAVLYWSMAAHTLYDNVDEVIPLFTPNLVMIDLANARLGINEVDDDGDCWSASQGKELIKVLRAIQLCRNLQHLNLSGNYIVQDNVVSLLPTLFPSFSQLTFLSFAEALPHDNKGLSCIGQSLESLPTLTYLDLSRNSLNYDMFDNLTKGLCALSQLKILNLSRNRLSSCIDYYEDYKGSVEEETTDALSWICNFIDGTSTIRKVSLRKNGFDEISFNWSEIAEEAGIKNRNLKVVQTKLLIEEECPSGKRA
jgi:hypothetical protein